MIITASASGQIQILSPAKINLFLHITGRRPDGYHTLISLMCCVSLYDIVRLSFEIPNISISCPHPQVPEDESNLAVRAADLFYRKLNLPAGVQIRIDKRIPVAAGLGGGSSNAAAVLLGLNLYYGDPLSQPELAALGLSIGADVPYFLLHKPAIVTGIGEFLEPYAGLLPLKVLLIYPGFGVSTAEIFKNINLGLTNHQKKFSLFSFKNKAFDIQRHLSNDLEAVASAKYPGIAAAKNELIRQGAVGCCMSGSGSCVFGLFNDPDKACRALDRVAEHTIWQCFLVDLLV